MQRSKNYSYLINMDESLIDTVLRNTVKNSEKSIYYNVR